MYFLFRHSATLILLMLMAEPMVAVEGAYAQGARGETSGRESASEALRGERGRSADRRQGVENRRGVRADIRIHPRIFSESRHRVEPRIRVDIRWPWPQRYERGWSPLYQYSQVVHMDVGWHGHRRDVHLEMRTYYRHRVRRATTRRARLDVDIERIEIYQDGRFVGEVHHIPGRLARIVATLERDRPVRFDRQLFLVGSVRDGFELVSTRYYNGRVLDRYEPRDGYRAGRLDFRRQRVVPVRRSRFFDPFDFRGFVPIELLPENEVWLADYGPHAPSGSWYGDGGGYFGLRLGRNDAFILGGDRTTYVRRGPRGTRSDLEGDDEASIVEPMHREDDVRYETNRGVDVRIRREATLDRVE